jgi:nucleotidyltransferase substrate binding protein (TIGR01987 family)
VHLVICQAILLADKFDRPFESVESLGSAPVAQLDRVPDYESGGRRFKSFPVHHFFSSSPLTLIKSSINGLFLYLSLLSLVLTFFSRRKRLMADPDVRSKQRLSNFQKAFGYYEEAVSLKMSRLSEEGLIRRFKYTFELAWKYLQDVLQERGYTEVRGPRPVIEQAFQDGLISNGPLWMDMLKARNATTHLYEQATFESIIKNVKGPFYEAFVKFRASRK